MTQRQITHMIPVPGCEAGHPARHMLDHRGSHAGGGHFIECRCRQTMRHGDADAALADWCRLNHFPHQWSSKLCAPVVQLPLPIAGGRRA
jgi:hypothetical protein